MADIGPLTYRELYTMADAAQRNTWQHTSSLLSMMANVARDGKKRPQPYRPSDFNPYERKRRTSKPGLSITADKIDLLGNILCGNDE